MKYKKFVWSKRDGKLLLSQLERRALLIESHEQDLPLGGEFSPDKLESLDFWEGRAWFHACLPCSAASPLSFRPGRAKLVSWMIPNP